MGTKLEPSAYDCYDRALPDEPMFTLLARDPAAPLLLRLWADQRRAEILRGNYDQDDLRMCTEAEMVADEMISWRKVKDGSWKIPEERRAQYNDDNNMSSPQVTPAAT